MFRLTCCSNNGNNFWSLVSALFGYQVRARNLPSSCQHRIPSISTLGRSLHTLTAVLSERGLVSQHHHCDSVGQYS